MDELQGLANRGYTEGFYRRHLPTEYQNYEQGNSVHTRQQFVGEVSGIDPSTKRLIVEVKNRFSVKDQLMLITPKQNISFALQEMQNHKGESTDSAPGSSYQVLINVPGLDVDQAALERALLVKNLNQEIG
jgi:putative protease